MIARSLTVLVALLFAGGVAAQTARNIPADAPKGRFTALQLPVVAIDGKQYRLAPGARIFNANNLTVTPNLVPAGTPVRYELDAQGLVRTVWIVGAAPGIERSAPQR
jgi:hypothetical protein